MSLFHFPSRKRTLVAGLSLLSLSVIGGMAFAQEPPDDEPADEAIAVVTTQDEPDEKEEPRNKREQDEPRNRREQDELRKQRETLMKQRADLDKKLADISRKLGERDVRVFGNVNGNVRAFNFDTKPFIELRGKALEENKVANEARRKAVEELRKSMRGQNKEVAEEMKRAIEELERSEKARGNERRALRLFNDADGKWRTMPEIPAVPAFPKTEFRFDNKALTVPRNLENNKEFEASMRRFEQRMQEWQKQFEARMRDWQKQMEEKNDKRPQF